MGHMSEFSVKLSGMRRGSDDENQISRELQNLEEELGNILSRIDMRVGGRAAIRERLRRDLDAVSTARQKLQIMSCTLEQIVRIYDTTENRILGNGTDKGILDKIKELGEKIRETAKIYGIDSPSAYSRDPVNLCNGNYVYEKICLELDSLMELRFRIFYNIQRSQEGTLGRGWTHNYELGLVLEKQQIHIEQNDGSRLTFYQEEEKGHYYPVKGSFGSLEKTDQGYLLEDRERNRFFFDSKGRFIKKEDFFGHWILLSYDESGKLIKVEDQQGNSLNFSYEFTGRLSVVSDYTGRTVKLTYSDGQLASVTDPEERMVQYHYDEHGWLTELINPAGAVGLVNQYDNQGRTIKQSFPDGGCIQYEYLDEKNQVRMTEQNGNEILYEHDRLFRNTRNIYECGEERFEYNDNNLRTSYTDRRGNTSRYEYDEKGNVVRFVNALKDEVCIEYTAQSQIKSVAVNGVTLHKAEYNDRHLQSSIENGEGAREYFEYDEKGQVIRWFRADGSQIDMTYGDSGNLSSITNSMGGKTIYYYDEIGRVIQTEDALGNRTSYEYNANDQLTGVTDACGNKSVYEYDKCGNLIFIKDNNGGITRLEYNALNKPIAVTDPEGNCSRTEYDEMWNVKRQIAPDGGVTSYDYDRMHRLVRVTDANGAQNHMEYDANGNMIQRIDPEGGVYRLAYDALNRPIETVDPCGHRVKAVYDCLGNVTEVQFEDGCSEFYEYDLTGKITAFTDRSGYRREYTFNHMGRLTEVSDALGCLETYEYYPGGLLKKESLIDGSEREFCYDRNENLIEVREKDSACWSFTYDALGRVIRAEEAGGSLEAYEYDAMGNITSVIDGEGNRISYGYTARGQIREVKDGCGNETRYVYDSCGRLIQILQPENGRFDGAYVNQFNQNQKEIRTTSYHRDLAGNITEVCDPEGNVISYKYDGNGRILSQTDKDGYEIRCFYNPDGTEQKYEFSDGKSILLRYNALKQLTEMEDWLGVTKVRLDKMGRPEKVSVSSGEQIAYEWGIRGEKRRIVYPDGQVCDYHYDASMRLSECRIGEEKVSYHYYNNGKLKEKCLPHNVNIQMTYHPSGKIRQLTHTQSEKLIEKFIYGYDKAERKNRVEIETPEGKKVTEYQYNKAGSLVSVWTDGEETEAYRYDPFGNRSWSRNRKEEQSYQYNRLNQLIKRKDLEGEHYYIYDRRGNLRQEFLKDQIIRKLDFDERNQISSAEVNGMMAVYGYNGFGERISRSVIQNGTVTEQTDYVHDITRLNPGFLTVSQNGIQRNMLWDDNLLGYSNQGENTYYLTDERMTPVMTASRCGIAELTPCSVFGEYNRQKRESGEMIPGFTGFMSDSVTGYYYGGQREYDPAIGRFISCDPIPGILLVPLTLNAYSYCKGDPINYYDPTGAIAAWLAGGVVGAVVNVVTKVAGDVVDSMASGEVKISSWQSYVGAATGGFVSGSTFVVSGGNAALAGAAGSAAENFVTGGLNMITGETGYRKEDGYTWKNLLYSTASGAVEGAASGWVLGNAAKYIKIPGINKGRGSFQAIWKQVMTKAAKGQIANVTWRTLGKGMIAYGGVKLFDEILKKGKKKLLDEGKTAVINWCREIWEKYQNTTVATGDNPVRYLGSGGLTAECPAEGT